MNLTLRILLEASIFIVKEVLADFMIQNGCNKRNASLDGYFAAVVHLMIVWAVIYRLYVPRIFFVISRFEITYAAAPGPVEKYVIFFGTY